MRGPSRPHEGPFEMPLRNRCRPARGPCEAPRESPRLGTALCLGAFLEERRHLGKREGHGFRAIVWFIAPDAKTEEGAPSIFMTLPAFG